MGWGAAWWATWARIVWVGSGLDMLQWAGLGVNFELGLYKVKPVSERAKPV